MSFFAYHYIENILVALGGPRRKSFFNSDAVFNSDLVDIVVKQMIDYASAIGACRSQLALQIISNVYKDRNWDTNDAPNILDFINKMEKWNIEKLPAPNEIIKPPSFAKIFGETVSVSMLHNRKLQADFELMFISALLLGLANPEKFKLWYEKKFIEDKNMLEKAQEAGLKVDFIPTLQQYLSECDKMIKDYEQKIGNLPNDIPPRLIRDVKQLGINI